MQPKEILINSTIEVIETRGRLLNLQKNQNIKPKVKDYLNKAISDLRIVEADLNKLVDYEKESDSC